MKTTFAVGVFCWVLGASIEARAQFTSFLDGSSLPGDNGWTVENNPGVIVDLGGGNFGIQQTDDDTSGTGGRDGGVYDEYYMTLTDTSSTLATRFRVDSYSYTGTDTIDMLALTVAGGVGSPAIGLGIRDIGSGDRWVLLRFIYEGDNEGDPAGTLLDIAPVVAGEFNEARIHIDDATDLVRFSWNGSEVYNAVTPTDWGGDVGFPEFGASNYWAEGGTSTVTYDWVGYGLGYVPMPGDVNFDGTVNIFDINLVSANWGSPGGPTGDANADGNVDIFDINLISANWSSTSGAAAVPEPTSLLLAALGLAGALLNRLRCTRR